MSHYWAANEDDRLRAAQSQDWLADLKEFDADIVEAACTEWRRTYDKRPTIAAIRKICKEQREARASRKRLPPAPQQSPHPFPSREDYRWHRDQLPDLHTDEDWHRIRAYQAAWAELGKPGWIADREQFKTLFERAREHYAMSDLQ